MYQFTYWLEHFKELPPSKAQTIVKTTIQLSEKTSSACSSVSKLIECKAVGTYNRTKQAILRAHSANLSQAEKKALSLFGEFLEYCEYSSFKFPEEPIPMLAEYCKTMQMSYSYKAVLIHELVSSNPAGITTDELVTKISEFYRNRIDHGMIAEKEDSVFTKADVSPAAAKKIIISNPVQVLVDAKVIIWNKRTGIISFTSDYLPVSETARKEVVLICQDRLKRYYSSIKPKKTSGTQSAGGCSKKLKTLLKRLEAEIQNTTDKNARKRLSTIYLSICNELGINNKTKPKKKAAEKKRDIPAAEPTEYGKLSVDDPRKVGALVQASLALLEKIEYKFSRAQLENLLSLEWSNKTLKLNYAFFKLVDETKPLAEQRLDHLGNGRYYSRIFSFGGKRYLLTSQWYDKSKGPFIEWYNSLKPPKK